MAIPLLQQSALLALELFDARALDQRYALAGGDRRGVAVPTGLPLAQRLLGALQGQFRVQFTAMRAFEAGTHDRQFRRQGIELAAVARDGLAQILDLRVGNIEVRAPTLPQLTGVQYVLLYARHLRSGLVETRLDRGQRVHVPGLIGANALYAGLDSAQIGDDRLHRRFAASCRFGALVRFAAQGLQTQGQQLGLQSALLLFQDLIAPCRSRLTLQVLYLLVDLVAQIVQTIEVFARMADSIFGLAAPLLVARDAGGFLEESAQVIGPRLDDSRNHALLDDRVAARPQARTEEQLGDVLAAHFGAVDVIVGGAVAADHAAQRHFVVVRVRPADLAVGVVEHQFDRRRTQRFAGRRTVENDVGHRIAAQMLGRNLAHDPADRVDDV